MKNKTRQWVLIITFELKFFSGFLKKITKEVLPYIIKGKNSYDQG